MAKSNRKLWHNLRYQGRNDDGTTSFKYSIPQQAAQSRNSIAHFEHAKRIPNTHCRPDGRAKNVVWMFYVKQVIIQVNLKATFPREDKSDYVITSITKVREKLCGEANLTNITQ